MNKRNLKMGQTFAGDNSKTNYLSSYHENDIADILKDMSCEERKKAYRLLGEAKTAEVFAYFDEPALYVKELTLEKAAHIISLMDSDDAVDLLEKLEPKQKDAIVKKLDAGISQDVKRLFSYDEDEIGSYMTTNFVCIREGLSVRQAMSELVKQAGIHDNIMTLYVTDIDGKLVGAIDLKELITARENDSLTDIVITSYPYVNEHEKTEECIERIIDYAEDSIPVVNEIGTLIGVITSDDIIEMVDDEMGDDYAKLAGLTGEEDLTETVAYSIKKRLPWLVVLLFLGVLVSTTVGAFEGVVKALPIVICFQSMVLDMAGNVGTQSLAVTIRVLMDDDVSGKDKLKLLLKEAKIGLFNGGLLGILSFISLGTYIHIAKGYEWLASFSVSGCVGISLAAAMEVSSLIGTLIPMFFHKIKIDPAVASGPLITTINDLVAVVMYYGLAYLFLLK